MKTGKTVIERRTEYVYGPGGNDFTGVFAGAYTWEQLEGFIKDDRWGSPYTVTSRQERTVTYTEWKDVDAVH